MNSSEDIKYYQEFFEGEHFNLNGLALAADATQLDKIEALPEVMQLHLSDCQECREAVAELYHINREAGLRIDGLHPFFDKEKYQVLRKKTALPIWLKYAAIFVFVALSSIVVFTSMDGKGIEGVQQWISELFNGQNHDPFMEDPMIEPLVGMAFREDSLYIMQPLAGDTIDTGKFFTLQYKGYSSVELQLELLDNRGIRAYKNAVISGHHEIDSSFTPGLYYWKLSNGPDLLHLGKVYILGKDSEY